ncbi:MAG: hypothetical protein ACKVOU_12490 [Cytophagales bacterium]
MMEIVYSINKVPIRLTNERWLHISIGHPEVADFYVEILETIQSPLKVYEGTFNEKLALSKIENTDKYLIVVYKEVTDTDGFIITSFISNKLNYLNNKKEIWKRSQ